ncbi:unnamed protein product [Rotaria sp. Silwood2]|nr:unnamed protein product [Rotaria sp. Silwood2]
MYSNGIIKSIVEKTYLSEKDLQRSLAFEAEPDPMNNDQEQTCPTTEELKKAQAQQNELKKHVYRKDFDDDQQEIIIANADDLESIQLDQEEEEEEREMNEFIINPNNYDEKLDLDEDTETVVELFFFKNVIFFFFEFFSLKRLKEAKLDE